MQNVARGVELGGLATVIFACAMATPATAVDVPPPKVPNIQITPPKITPPKITAPQPTVKGNVPNPSKGPQQNMPTTTGRGETGVNAAPKVLPGANANQPGGGTATGGKETGVNTGPEILPGANANQPGGGTATGGKETGVNTGPEVLPGANARPGGTTTGAGENASSLQGEQPIGTSNTAPGGGTTTGDGVKVLPGASVRGVFTPLLPLQDSVPTTTTPSSPAVLLARPYTPVTPGANTCGDGTQVNCTVLTVCWPSCTLSFTLECHTACKEVGMVCPCN